MGTGVLHTRAVCLRAQTPAPGSEPLGGRQNLEAPATTWSPVGGGASRPQHFGLHHLLSVRGEIKEGPSAPSASPSSLPSHEDDAFASLPATQTPPSSRSASRLHVATHFGFPRQHHAWLAPV